MGARQHFEEPAGVSRRARAMAAAAILAALSTLGERAPIDDPLPEPARWRPPCVDTRYDLARVEIGYPEGQAFELFGKQVTRAPLWDQLQPQRCVAFQYDLNIVDDPPRALVVLVVDGRLQRKWLVEGTAWPPECGALPKENVTVRGGGCRPLMLCSLGRHPGRVVEQANTGSADYER